MALGCYPLQRSEGQIFRIVAATDYTVKLQKCILVLIFGVSSVSISVSRRKLWVSSKVVLRGERWKCAFQRDRVVILCGNASWSFHIWGALVRGVVADYRFWKGILTNG
ncbi:hypothetical protein V6N13_009835 [Hibiscus sabdariffa]|uniref:Uncharacterized protein n=1 Tax=Hibiscus sabdariffa TaxID=183260 RepID=A0ABR2BC39_9ROSI